MQRDLPIFEPNGGGGQHAAPESISIAMGGGGLVGLPAADGSKALRRHPEWIRAKLPGKSFKTQHRTFWYHHGMQAKTEVKIQSKPFLVTLLPALEKYLPD